jgi:iron-sulfur cluster repair protein YtfE (RIC family)
MESGMEPTASWTINEVLRADPRAAQVLNLLGIDICCGGSLSLAEASRAVGESPESVLAAIRNLNAKETA